jgi:hypothetical protein
MIGHGRTVQSASLFGLGLRGGGVVWVFGGD